MRIHTIVVDGPLALRMRRLDAARDPILKSHATMYIRDRSTRSSHQAPVYLQARITNCPLMGKRFMVKRQDQ